MKKQLLHFGWQLTTVGKNDTIPATVPGSVYNDLLNAGRMEDPYWRDIMLCGGTAAAWKSPCPQWTPCGSIP